MNTTTTFTFKNFFDACLRHPFIALFLGALTLFYTIEGAWAATSEPEKQMHVEIAKMLVNTSIKIMDIEAGCQGNNGLARLVQAQNAQRIDYVDQLQATVTADTVERELNSAAKQEINRFVAYNHALNQRANVCAGKIKPASEIVQWEKSILTNLHQS